MFSPDAATPSGTAAILRALGSLMAALGGDESVGLGRPAIPAPRVETTYQPQSSRAEAPRPAAGRPGGTSDAELLLHESRERADQILQDSMRRASELLNREPRTSGIAGTPEDIEPIRRNVDELLRGMRDVQVRPDRIETLMATERAAAAAPAPAPAAPSMPVAPPRPTYTPIEDERRPGVLSVVAPQPPVRPISPPPMSAPPSALPSSAMPPMRASAPPPPTFVDDEVPPYDDEDDDSYRSRPQSRRGHPPRRRSMSPSPVPWRRIGAAPRGAGLRVPGLDAAPGRAPTHPRRAAGDRRGLLTG